MDIQPTVALLRREGLAALATLGNGATGETDLLLAVALGRDRAWLRAHADARCTDAGTQRFRDWLRRRATGEPVAYLLGSREFWSLPLMVTPAVLIPRADTERLVELAVERLPRDTPLEIADLGTGSGAIALAIASERPDVRVTATDNSPAALDVARTNADRLGLAGQIDFRHGEWFAALPVAARFDMIVSNPPYIADGDPHLAEGDLRFEPVSALTSGADGLDAIRTIVAVAGNHLESGGWLLLEHGHDQGDAVRTLMRDAGFENIVIERDLAGNDRVALGRYLG
jgi:release factor glutamine methyltransferase